MRACRPAELGIQPAVQARAGFAENRGRGGDNYELQWLYR